MPQHDPPSPQGQKPDVSAGAALAIAASDERTALVNPKAPASDAIAARARPSSSVRKRLRPPWGVSHPHVSHITRNSVHGTLLRNRTIVSSHGKSARAKRVVLRPGSIPCAKAGRLDWWIDWDVLYKFNTAGGAAGDNELRADVAYSHRLFGGESEVTGPWGLYAIAELNAKYFTDGSAQAFASPGLQYITPNLILEAGVQLPVGQDLKSPRLETDYTVVVSLRLQF